MLFSKDYVTSLPESGEIPFTRKFVRLSNLKSKVLAYIHSLHITGPEDISGPCSATALTNPTATRR